MSEITRDKNAEEEERGRERGRKDKRKEKEKRKGIRERQIGIDRDRWSVS